MFLPFLRSILHQTIGRDVQHLLQFCLGSQSHVTRTKGGQTSAHRDKSFWSAQQPRNVCKTVEVFIEQDLAALLPQSLTTCEQLLVALLSWHEKDKAWKQLFSASNDADHFLLEQPVKRLLPHPSSAWGFNQLQWQASMPWCPVMHMLQMNLRLMLQLR